MLRGLFRKPNEYFWILGSATTNNVIQNIVVAQKKNGKLDKPYFWQYKLNFINSKVYLTQVTVYKANGVKINSNNINPCDDILCDDYIPPTGGIYIGGSLSGSGGYDGSYGGYIGTYGSTYGGGYYGNYGGFGYSGGSGGSSGGSSDPCTPSYTYDTATGWYSKYDCNGVFLGYKRPGENFNDDCCNDDDIAVGPVLTKGFDIIISSLLTNEPYGNAQPDPEHPAVKSMKAAMLQLRFKGYNSEFCDLFDDLLSDLSGITMGDLHDVYKMIVCAVGEYNSQAKLKRDENLAHAMMSIMSPDNFATIFAFGNFFPTRTPITRKIDVFIAKKAASFVPDLSKGFTTFEQFKSANGSAGFRRAWHHIVEQNQIGKSGFDPRMVHHPDNIVNIEGGFTGALHESITGAYAKVGKYISNTSLRDYLVGKPFHEQYEWGLKVLKEFQ